jgi:hypothetical protein
MKDHPDFAVPLTKPCDCKIADGKIEYCQVHNAAPQMYAAIRAFINWHSYDSPRLEDAVLIARNSVFGIEDQSVISISDHLRSFADQP